MKKGGFQVEPIDAIGIKFVAAGITHLTIKRAEKEVELKISQYQIDEKISKIMLQMPAKGAVAAMHQGLVVFGDDSLKLNEKLKSDYPSLFFSKWFFTDTTDNNLIYFISRRSQTMWEITTSKASTSVFDVEFPEVITMAMQEMCVIANYCAVIAEKNPMTVSGKINSAGTTKIKSD